MESIPMKTQLVYKYKNEDKRELSFEDWIVYIIKQEVNQKRLPWIETTPKHVEEIEELKETEPMDANLGAEVLNDYCPICGRINATVVSTLR